MLSCQHYEVHKHSGMVLSPTMSNRLKARSKPAAIVVFSINGGEHLEDVSSKLAEGHQNHNLDGHGRHGPQPEGKLAHSAMIKVAMQLDPAVAKTRPSTFSPVVLRMLGFM